MMIRVKDPGKVEYVRRTRGDKSPTETVNALVDEANMGGSKRAIVDALASVRAGNTVTALLILENELDRLGGVR